MTGWQSRLAKLRDFGNRLPEPWCDVYRADPPSGQPWPDGLPTCPTLAEFYRICDGAHLGSFNFSRLEKLQDDTDSLKDWLANYGAGEGEDEDEVDEDDYRLNPGQFIHIGGNDLGLHLIWDAEKDAMICHDGDGQGWYAGSEDSPLLGRSAAAFLEGLFSPEPSSDDEEERDWAESLARLESFS